MDTSKNVSETIEKRREVPKTLERLIRLLCKAIYEPELIIIVNMLLAWKCVRRDHLEKLCLYSKNGMEAALNTLHAEKIIKKKQLYVDTSRIEAWHINYGGIVNIIRFKLYKMQAKITEEQKRATCKAEYTCTNCGKSFSEMHMDRLINQITGDLSCTFCNGRVVENEKDVAADKRNLTEQFNAERKKFDELLEKLEGVVLHEDVCNPIQPAHIPHLDKRYDAAAIQASKQCLKNLRAGIMSPITDPTMGGEGVGPTGSQARGPHYWQNRYQFDDSVLYGKGLTIEILSNSEQRRRHLKENQVAKEVPTWMKVSTVSGAEKDADRGVSKADEIKNTWDDWYDEDDDDEMFDEDEEIGKKKPGTGGGRWAQKRNEEVQKLCFQYEKKNQADDSDDSDSDSDDEMNYEICYPSLPFSEIPYKVMVMDPNAFNQLSKEEKMNYKRYLQSEENYPAPEIQFLTDIS